MGIRENILANIKTELAELSNVIVVRRPLPPAISEVETLQGSSTYLLVVCDGGETSVAAEKGHREYLNRMEVQINGYIEDKDNPSTTLNTLLHNVKAKMEEDPTRSGNAYETSRLRVEVIPNLEHPHTGFRIFYQIRYEE